MARIVMKFGGTSVADLDRIHNVARHVKREVDAGHEVAVVVSAMSGKTNELVGWVKGMPKVSGANSPFFDAREYDAVVASGEQVTAVMHSGEPFAIGTAVAGQDGTVAFAWDVPASAEFGDHRIVLAGATSGSAEHALRVLVDPLPLPAAPGSRRAGALAGTGTDSEGPVSAGLELLLVGALLVLIARIRRGRRRTNVSR